MARSDEVRALTTNETALLLKIVRAVHEDVAALDAQVGAASVVGGLPTLLDLSVHEGVEPAPIEDGPLPVRALVSDPAGEILVWIKSGYLNGLEFAWTGDETPTDMPPVQRVALEL